MSNPFLRTAVRTWFLTTTRQQATRRIENSLQRYLMLAKKLDGLSGRKIVIVPAMPGVDSDMREWSFFMLMEHNAIVNRSITAIVEHLATGRPIAEAGEINPKVDVMPTCDAGQGEVSRFEHSVEEYLKLSSSFEGLRNTQTIKHPVFGELNAHGWHCMFGFHLNLHLKQASLVAENALSADTKKPVQF